MILLPETFFIIPDQINHLINNKCEIDLDNLAFTTSNLHYRWQDMQ